MPDAPGELPEKAPAVRLSTLVMRRAVVVVSAVLLAIGGTGLLRAEGDIEDELGAALRLVRSLEPLTHSAGLSPEALLQSLQASKDGPTTLRHLTLSVRDSDGRLLLQRGPQPTPDGMAATLATWHRAWRHDPDLHPVVWRLPGPSGGSWTVTLAPAAESERHEALSAWVQGMGLALAGAAGLLGVLGWTVHRSLSPLHALAMTLPRLRPGDTRAARELPTATVSEVAEVSSSVSALAAALDHSEAERRLLSQQMIALEEAERARLARELHDEWGQRLTGLRLDASLLGRLPRDDAGWLEALKRLDAQCASLQHDLRHRLHELAPRSLGDGRTEMLEQALSQLVRSWSARGADAPTISLLFAAAGPDRPLQIPPAVALCLFRASQEALTNVARHAQATTASLRVSFDSERVHWCVTDNGIGIPDPHAAELRGSGLAQLRERVWALGGDWQSGPANASLHARGWQLAARVPIDLKTSEP